MGKHYPKMKKNIFATHRRAVSQFIDNRDKYPKGHTPTKVGVSAGVKKESSP